MTGASRTAQARTVGKVSANFSPAYDILVRPKGTRSAVESKTGTVAPDFLSGIYGGITVAQWHQIERIPGVQVAAPIAMVGYADLGAAIFMPVPTAALTGSGRQLYRISTTWVSDNGASRVTEPPGYLYITPRRLIIGPVQGATPTDVSGAGCEVTRDSTLAPGTNPFGTAAQSAVTFAFRGIVVGSLLGDAVAVQVRGVDYIAAAATAALGVLAVADVVFLNIRERAAELATIRSFGWREAALTRLVITEGAIIGVTGSLAGAGLGLAAAAWFAGQLPARLLVIAAVAVVAGILITAIAALLPAALLRRLPGSHLLAEE